MLWEHACVCFVNLMRIAVIPDSLSFEGVVTTVAGTGASPFADGVASVAAFSGPQGLAFDSSGNIYVGDYFGYRLRKVTFPGIVHRAARLIRELQISQ